MEIYVVCNKTCTHTHLNTHTHLHLYTHTHTYIHTQTHPYTHTHTIAILTVMWRYANNCAYISNRYADTFVDAHHSIKHTHTHLHLYTHTHTHTDTYNSITNRHVEVRQ